MASIASPRPMPASGTSTPTISSRRTSLDTTRTASPSRLAPHSTGNNPNPTRRNRAALRDYYNLKPSAGAPDPVPSSSASVASEDDSVVGASSELDQPGFDAAIYVSRVLEREGLQGVLKIESGLLNEIRELDGERKALVYDNYSKLIAATDTIKGMRRNMVPLGASTGDLEGMVRRIAGTAGELSGSGSVAVERGREGGATRDGEKEKEQRQRQREMVRWVVQSPERLRKLVADGELEAADKEWDSISKLLDRWKGVPGVDNVRERCREAMNES